MASEMVYTSHFALSILFFKQETFFTNLLKSSGCIWADNYLFIQEHEEWLIQCIPALVLSDIVLIHILQRKLQAIYFVAYNNAWI